MDESWATQNRQSRRSNVLLTATVEFSGQAVAVKLRNLSAEGALIEGPGLPVEGTEVLFRRNELAARSRIVWVDDRFAGVAFAQRLAPEQVLRHIPVPRPRIRPEHRRPGLKSRELTAEERRLVESWVWAVSPRLGE